MGRNYLTITKLREYLDRDIIYERYRGKLINEKNVYIIQLDIPYKPMTVVADSPTRLYEKYKLFIEGLNAGEMLSALNGNCKQNS